MRPQKVLPVVLAAAVLAVPLLTVSSAEAGVSDGIYDEYVALGDSWSADVVIADTNGTPDTTHAPIGCGQSHTNYPKLLAGELGITNFRDATFSGEGVEVPAHSIVARRAGSDARTLYPAP